MFKIIRKELQTLSRDRRSLILGLLMPIILITVFSFAFGGMDSKEDKKSNLLICNADKSPFSYKVVRGIDSIKTLAIDSTTEDSAINLVKSGKYPAALLIHKGFADSANASKPLPWELRYDATQPIEMQMMQEYLAQSVFSNMGRTLNERLLMKKAESQYAGMDSMSKTMALFAMKQNIEAGGKSMDEIQKIIRIKNSPVSPEVANTGVIQAVSGTAVMMLLFSLAAMGGRIIEEKENGTLKRLLYSPLSTSDIINGKLLASMIFATVQLLIMFTYSSAAFGLVLAPKLPATILLIIVTAYACSSFGMFLASIVKTRDQVQAMSTLIVLCMSAIGGSMVPSALMPGWMQTVGHASINYWSVQGFYDIFWRQLSITDPVFLVKVGVLLLFGIILSTTAYRLFKRNVISMT